MTPSEPSTDARIDELEARLAHQDQAVLELSNEVYRQQQQIAHLETRLRQLADRLSSIGSEESAGNASDEVPPHY